MNDYIYLLVGKSGSGKSTIAKILEDKYNWKNLLSYTTRKPRFDGEKGHIFSTKEEFDGLKNKVAYTFFDGNEYCATQNQVEESDVYIIDPYGIKFFMELYKGNKKPVVCVIDVNAGNAVSRMEARGDNIDTVLSRAKHDMRAFENIESELVDIGAPYVVYNSNILEPNTIARMIYEDRERRYEQCVSILLP